MNNKYDPITGKVIPVFLHYAVPSVIGMLAVSSAGVIDGIFIGNFVGARALGLLFLPFWFGDNGVYMAIPLTEAVTFVVAIILVSRNRPSNLI